ncbi:MAG: DNA/RNA helicase domain-containing protein [Elusimicrobiota bacterium]
MIIYQSTKDHFLKDVFSNSIDKTIVDYYFKKTGKHVGQSEQESWKMTARWMRDVLNDNEIPNDSGVTIEYQIPQTSKRIDFILTGKNEHDTDYAVLIELKQWSKAKLTDKDGVVLTSFYGEVSHPSYQAWSYAALIQGFNETVYKENIQLRPCAYLHNYIEDNVIRNDFYAEYIKKAPVFLEGDAEKEKLQAFIKQFVKHGDKSKVMYRIDEGRIRPSKSLADSLVKMLKGNQEFVMIDDQKIVYETALSLAKQSSAENKNVLIVSGGPGTGKSVVAINLIVALSKIGLVTQYVTKNAAPRAVYESMLTGTLRKTEITNLFSGSGFYVDVGGNLFDALVVDEAHRLNKKSGMFRNKGENQIKEIIEASKFSVFFIDEDQKVTWHDIGEKEEIRKWAKKSAAKVYELDLASQFRCNGSDGYLAWLDDILQIKETSNSSLDVTEYDFQIMDSPTMLRDAIFEKNKENNKARLVAGYCWDWVSKSSKAMMDIKISEHNFAMRWNLESDGNLWILSPESVSEVGCIHTCQGLDLDYVGVIVGSDLIVREGKVITDPNKRAKTDASLKGYKKALKSNPEDANKKADLLIRNTYRTLMTRAMKGCYVYFIDKETERYFKWRIDYRKDIPIQKDTTFEILTSIPEVNKYKEYLPLYSLKAAAGKFGESQEVAEEGWVAVNVGKKLDKKMFIAKVVGHSMEPLIPNNSYCIFRADVVGSRQGKIVLVQHHSIKDLETGGTYTVKKYRSDKKYYKDETWQHERIILEPLNNDFEPIKLTPQEDGEFKVIAEFISVL